MTNFTPPTRRGNPITNPQTGAATQEFHRYLENLGLNVADTQGPQGDPGANGSKIFLGSGTPAPALGSDTDVYIDLVTSEIYKKDGATWVLEGTIQSIGSKIHTGSGAPASGLGDEDDFYVDVDTGDVYTKSGGVWSLDGNIQGPQGDAGPAGPQGPQGPQGDSGVESKTAEALEALAAGQICNIYDDAGTPKIRKADASSNTTLANAYVKQAYTAGQTAEYFWLGEAAVPPGDTLTSDDPVFLSETPGEVTLTPVTTSGAYWQPIGRSAGGSLLFDPQPAIRRL